MNKPHTWNESSKLESADYDGVAMVYGSEKATWFQGFAFKEWMISKKVRGSSGDPWSGQDW